jgi:tetratricopeptide (TPR) repeat protein
MVALERGVNSFEANDLSRAEEAWKEARNRSSAAREWPKAVFNLALLETKRAEYRKAIGYFNEVLESHPNDTEPGNSIMETYRNYSHRSSLGISDCYEKMGDYRGALRYAKLAKTQYPFRSWCGTCLQSANFALNKRIARLTTRIYGMPLLAVVVLVGSAFTLKKVKSSKKT